MKRSSPIPFAKQAYRRDAALTPEQILVNLIVEKDESDSDPETVMLLNRPGLELLATLGGPIQAVFAPNNAMSAGFPSLIVVAANSVYSVVGSTAAMLGTITGTDIRVAIAGNFDRIAIVANGCLWLYGASTGSTANTFRQVAVPTPYRAVDVTTLDGYFIVAMSTGTYYWLVPGDDDWIGVVRALQFATAESQPDGLVGVECWNGNLLLFGATTVELDQTTGNADLPFQRIPNSGYPRGCLSRDTIQQIDNSVFWVGEDAKVYRVAGVPQKISTTGIDERLKQRSGSVSAWTFSYSGHLFYVLNIPSQGSFAYDVSTQIWSEFASEGSTTWRAHVGASNSDTVICGDSTTGALYTVTDTPTDNGTLIRRTTSASVAIVGSPVRNDSFAIDVATSAAATINLRWADADELLSDQPWQPLAAPAGASVLSMRRLSTGRAPYRQFEIEITDPVTVRISGARIGDVWR